MVNSTAESVNHYPVPEDIMVELHLVKIYTMIVNNLCRLQIHKSSVHMQEEHSKVLQCGCYAD